MEEERAPGDRPGKTQHLVSCSLGLRAEARMRM
jgi:hypothetical protein